MFPDMFTTSYFITLYCIIPSYVSSGAVVAVNVW